MIWSVYVIKSKEGNLYTGMSKDINTRISEHNSGYSKWTKRGSFWESVYSEKFDNSKKSHKREKYFKTNSGKEWL
ncbi:MAG: GIY-YIG nuclease family protein [Candidatus Marinimicrobia bacterium]|nr:GIY-YIG nuclease family protein [Candidatus Neomarinimicrobiota bacterium]